MRARICQRIAGRVYLAPMCASRLSPRLRRILLALLVVALVAAAMVALNPCRPAPPPNPAPAGKPAPAPEPPIAASTSDDAGSSGHFDASTASTAPSSK